VLVWDTGARSDQAHVAPEHVEELGQLSRPEARSSQPPGMMPRVAPGIHFHQGSVRVDQVIAMPLVDFALGIGDHGAELIAHKTVGPVPDALLPEENRSGRRDLNHDGDRQADRATIGKAARQPTSRPRASMLAWNGAMLGGII